MVQQIDNGLGERNAIMSDPFRDGDLDCCVLYLGLSTYTKGQQFGRIERANDKISVEIS